MEPLVSFVVPCYKLAHLLPQCIESMLGQTYRKFEILIMNNCSPDNTSEVATSFADPRVLHIRNETNIGHVRNFNKGIAMARGKYVWVVSADDWLRSPEVLGRYVDLMERDSKVGYVFCRAVEVRGSKEVGTAQWSSGGEKDRVWDGRRFLRRLIQHNFIVMSSTMVRKECYERLGTFSLEFPYANDWYLWCVLALHYQVGYMSEPMVSVRVHEESLTSAFSRGGSPLCAVDELKVLWRVAQLAKLAGMSHLRDFNKAIALLAAQALTYGPPGRFMPKLKDAEFEDLLREHVADPRDEEDIRARVHMAIGDEQFWHSHNEKAAQAYWLALRLRAYWVSTWAKYLLLRTGGIGLYIRRLILNLREYVAEAI